MYPIWEKTGVGDSEKTLSRAQIPALFLEIPDNQFSRQAILLTFPGPLKGSVQSIPTPPWGGGIRILYQARWLSGPFGKGQIAQTGV